ncbi:DUF799 family lipoprotein [Campylobacter sp. faydin G-140]|uniref:DUF799 domain-containing protein n=1 Tax=Campylobacter anatolicus TaxID=2829105 RepID=UPI001B9E6B4D|nr:GNA1162 family protein [Campylobacter anatolicus]MBR8466438.1 DUF799 family lipoprotein [Campylobacter anatolicus]
MNKFKLVIFSAFLAIFLSACNNTQPQPYDYSAFLQSKPRSILVLMPTNETTEMDGSAAVLAHAVQPLSVAGYYVFPPALVNDTFKHNGITEANDIHQISLSKIKQIFNPDAVLYINISEYGSSYALITATTIVGMSAKLVDVDSGRTLWDGRAIVSDGGSGGGGGIVGMLISAVVSQIANTISDKGYKLSATADWALFGHNCNGCILLGPYANGYGQDKQLNTAK